MTTTPALPQETTAHYIVRWTEPVDDCDDPFRPLGRTIDQADAETDDDLAELLYQRPDQIVVYQDRHSQSPDRWLNRFGRCIGCDRHPMESCFC